MLKLVDKDPLQIMMWGCFLAIPFGVVVRGVLHVLGIWDWK